jgi:hypothetical protein
MLISYHVKQKEPPKLQGTLSPGTDIRTYSQDKESQRWEKV